MSNPRSISLSRRSPVEYKRQGMVARKTKFDGTKLRLVVCSPENHNILWQNLTPNPFPRRKWNRIYADREQSSALRATLRLTPGAGVTPAEGGVEPIAGSTFDDDRIERLS